MALHLTAKAPDDVLDYRWEPPLDEGDGLASYSIAVSGATLGANAIDDDAVAFYVSGGAAGATAIITLSAETNEGRYFEETLYLPIRASANAFGYTVRDVCGFALRKVVGIDSDPDADELADAAERLSDMLANWAGQGADLGVKLPCAASDTLYISDAFASAVKNSLIIELADLYGFEPSQRVIMNAMRGLQMVKASKLPAEREGAEFF